MPTRRTLTRLLPAIALLGVTGTALLSLAALRGAGLNGKPPPNSAVIKKLIDDLTDNWTWLIGTGMGLVLIILAGLLMVGSRTAPDWLFKVIGGVLLILVVIPTALA